MKKVIIVSIVMLLAGCSSAASRMAECRDQGYSRNTCYQVEQNRQAAREAAILSASEAQAYKNQEEALGSSHHHHHHRSGN